MSEPYLPESAPPAASVTGGGSSLGHRTDDGPGSPLPPEAPVTADSSVEPTAAVELPSDPGQPLSPAFRQLLFGLSLPERLLRSGIGLTAGLVRESATFLVPRAFQSSRSYEIAITNSLIFLTETVGGVRRDTLAEETSGDQAADFVARKAVGNFVDLAALATLHVSPMWILAVVSDVAYGTRTYLQELSAELKAQGLIDETSTIHNVDDVLNALQDASGKAACRLDQPPFSMAGLRAAVDEARESLAHADVRKLLPQRELQRYWEEMRSLAEQENVSLLQVSGALTMQTLGRIRTLTEGTLTGVRVAGGILNRDILGHYLLSMQQIHERGYYTTVREASAPYLQAVWHNFAAERESWTENLLNPRHIQSRVGQAWSWLTGVGNPPPAPSPSGESPLGSTPKDDTGQRGS